MAFNPFTPTITPGTLATGAIWKFSGGRLVGATVPGIVTWDVVFDGGGSGTGTQTQPSVVTGIDPNEIANALYGKIIPLSALGLARIGTAGLIFGPYFNSGAASFAVSFGFPANPAGERQVYEIALDGKVAWENAAGNPAGTLGAGFTGDAFDCRFYSGTLTQGADPLEVGQFGAEAVAYRPQMMLWFSNLPVAPYDGKVPFVSAKIGDVTGGATPGDGINLGEALERVAYSPWLEYDGGTFETNGVGDIVQAMILTENQSFLNLLQTTNRIYRTLDIVQTDKLRINDRGSTVVPDLTLHRDHISAESGVQYSRQEMSAVARELELVTIDPDADYVFMPSKASRPMEPVPVTASRAKDSITLPVVIDANTRMALVTYAKYEEENARKRIGLQTMLYGYALEPGDLFRVVGIADGFDNNEVFKVVETSHGANYINEIAAEAILKCAIGFDDVDPFWPDVLLLLHANESPPIDSSSYAASMAFATGAYRDTSIVRYGAGSFYFDGSGARVITTSSLDHFDHFSDTNISPYTIECWVMFERVGHSPSDVIVCRNGGLIGYREWHLYQKASSTELGYQSSANGISMTHTTTTSGAGLVNGVWYHLAVDKDSTGTIRIYVNGVMRASNTPADSSIVREILEEVTVGSTGTVDFQNPFQGHIDDVRITKRSRYGDLYGDASFAPPPSQFPHGP